MDLPAGAEVAYVPPDLGRVLLKLRAGPGMQDPSPLAAVSLPSGESRTLLQDLGDWGGQVSPDGKTWAAIRHDSPQATSAHLELDDLESGEKRELAHPAEIHHIWWSPDSKAIAWTGRMRPWQDDPLNGGLFWQSAEGGESLKITDEPSGYDFICWGAGHSHLFRVDQMPRIPGNQSVLVDYDLAAGSSKSVGMTTLSGARINGSAPFAAASNGLWLADASRVIDVATGRCAWLPDGQAIVGWEPQQPRVLVWQRGNPMGVLLEIDAAGLFTMEE